MIDIKFLFMYRILEILSVRKAHIIENFQEISFLD